MRPSAGRRKRSGPSFVRRRLRLALEEHALDAAPPDALHHHLEHVEHHRLAGARNAPERVVDETADRREIVALEIVEEDFGQVGERQAPGYPEARRPVLDDRWLLDVV